MYIFFILFICFFFFSPGQWEYVKIHIYKLYYASYYISLRIFMHMHRVTTYKLVYIEGKS